MMSSFFFATERVLIEKKNGSNPSKAALTPGNSYSGINVDTISEARPFLLAFQVAAQPRPLPKIGRWAK